MSLPVFAVFRERSATIDRGLKPPLPNPVNLDASGILQRKFVTVGDDMFIGGQPTERALRDLRAERKVPVALEQTRMINLMEKHACGRQSTAARGVSRTRRPGDG